jgi:hypothetical protein
VAALAAGCGGDDEAGDTGTTPVATAPAQTAPAQTAPAQTAPAETAPSGGGRAAFIERADAACADAREDMAALGPDARKPEGIRRIAARLERLAGQIRAARPPARDRQSIAEFTAGVERVADLLRTIVGQMEGQDPDAARETGEQLRTEAAKVARLAEQYGFRDCGRATPQP